MTIEIGKLSIKSSVGDGKDKDAEKKQDEDKEDGDCCGKPGARRTSAAGAWLADLRRQAEELAERARER
ncbi:hypothetical protein [Pseudoduganella armeniaca]|uniref:Uncharacterized protein n=1 Tax=Pseudoduganella armeniaca TaxID=2072590 RepID=A0A2R4CBW1_9BURK|nr:hypothetical protein [Pseudoduganella armeniaca]AVR97123.1 hypothetical protein C9I28_16825 [Pseudoduganella armeniaca]